MKLFSCHIFLYLGIVFLFLLTPNFAEAQNFFGVTPTKIELSLRPGESETRKVKVVNDFSVPKRFIVSVEDFTDGSNGDDVVIGNEPNNPMSLYRYLYANQKNFVLQPGQEIDLNVAVNLPANMNPGSKHAVLLISSIDLDAKAAAAKTIARVGVLFFVRVEGEENFSGQLVNAGLLGGPFLFGDKEPTVFLSYENSGNTYLNPYGYIEIQNVFSRQKKQVAIEPWFVLPESSRIREVPTVSLFGGVYTFKVLLNRGYDNIIDTEQHYLFVLSVKFIILLLVLILAIIYIGWRWYSKKLNKNYEY